MKIEMKPGKHPTNKSARVWWWQIVKEDGGSRVDNGVGWEWTKNTAYASAIRSLRVERARRSVDVSTD
jgi:hypothetical protein